MGRRSEASALDWSHLSSFRSLRLKAFSLALPRSGKGPRRRLGSSETFSAEFSLKLPLRDYRWSIAIRDVPTGLVSFVVADSHP